MKKGYWIAGGVGCGCCLLLVIIFVGVLIYLGLGVNWSGLTAWGGPKDLGVRYTAADLAAGREMTGVELIDLEGSEGGSIEFEGTKEISGEYTSEMITAMINSAGYRYYPFTDTQVLIHPDGSVESSGVIDLNKLMSWAGDISGDGSIGGAEEYFDLIDSTPSFYISGNMSVTDNNFDINIDEAQVSFFTAKSDQIAEYTPLLESFVETQVNSVPGMYVRSAEFIGGELQLDADYPAVELTRK